MKLSKKTYRILFATYIIFLILIVVLKFDGSFKRIAVLHNSIVENKSYGINNINFVLFKSLSPYLTNITEPYAFKNFIGNIIAFVPMGFLIPPIFLKESKNFIKTFFLCFIIILAIEIVQLIFEIGFFDVDDIFLNMMGCLVGYKIYLCLRKSKL